MSKLTQFLLDNPVDGLKKEVVISKRLAELPFTITAMSGEQFNEYQRKATAIGRHKKVDFDTKSFNESVILNHCVDPNFKNAEDMKAAGCTTPEQYMYKVLLAGEMSALAQEISVLSGFDRDMDDLVEEGKNS